MSEEWANAILVNTALHRAWITTGDFNPKSYAYSLFQEYGEVLGMSFIFEANGAMADKKGYLTMATA